jgi:integrase
MMALAVRQKLISSNPCGSVEIGTDGKRTAIPSSADYSRLWSALETMRAAGGTMAHACDVVALIALTGARKSEIRLLRWRHLDLEAREIRLPANEHKAGHRTGKVRTIALSDAAVAILAGCDRGLPDALVFPGGSARVAVDLSRPWKRIAKAAELPADISLHSLRHGIGSTLRNAGSSLLEIASVLGHASVRTAERYAHAGDLERGVLAQKAADLVRPVRLRAVS